MFYFIYVTTCLVNGKKYIGKHQTLDLDDNYLGSGVTLKKAVKKYGRQNFLREIVQFASSGEELSLIEQQYINGVVVSDPSYYNIAYGGNGGVTVLTPNHPLYESTRVKISTTHKARRHLTSVRMKELHSEKRVGMYGKKHTQATKQKMRSNSARLGKPGTALGRRLTPEQKEKIGQPKRGVQRSEHTCKLISQNHHDVKGNKNPMAGCRRKAIYHPITGENKTLIWFPNRGDPTPDIPLGWVQGRKKNENCYKI